MCTSSSPSARLLMGAWVASISQPLEVVLQWTQGYIHLFKFVFQTSLDQHPEVDLPGRAAVWFQFGMLHSKTNSQGIATVLPPP